MKRPSSPTDLAQPARQAAAHPWVEKLARLGYAAKGVVYFTVGLLAAQAAFGGGGRTTDTEGALYSIVNQPFGQFLLALIAIGMVGYALWRAIQALFDPEQAGSDPEAKRIAQRIGFGFSALVYGGLAVTAIRLAMGSENSGGGSGNTTQDWTARFLAQPFGQWLVGLAGLVVVGVGLSYLYNAYKAKFQEELMLRQMSASERKWAKRCGQFGIAARGIVFSLIGIFLIQAAWQADASEARGFGEALGTLVQQPFGPWILGLVALGLIAFSVYSLVEARYRQIIH